MAHVSRPVGGRDEPYPPASSSGSIAELLSDIVGNIQNIIRSEVRLAKTEITEEATAAGKAAGILAAGVVLALYAVGFLLLCLVYALRGPLPDWAAALVVGLAVAGVAGLLVMVGVQRIKNVDPKPEQTIDTIKEDVQWVKQQTR